MTADTEPFESVDGGASVPEGRKGKRCCGVLLGHTADVSHIKWNATHSLWVTGSEDYSVCFWTAEGEQQGKWLPGDAVTALAIDQKYGLVIAASMDRAVRLYDPIAQEVVQQHVGHSDAVSFWKRLQPLSPPCFKRCSHVPCTGEVHHPRA